MPDQLNILSASPQLQIALNQHGRVHAAIHRHDWNDLQNALNSNATPAYLLGEALVNVAANTDLTALEQILNSYRLKEIDSSYLNEAIESASCNCRMDSLEKILTSSRAGDISPKALARAHFSATGDLGSATVIRLILQLKTAAHISMDDIGTDFRRTAERGADKFVQEILTSPVAHKISDEDVGCGYVRALELKHTSTAKIIRSLALNKIKITEVDNALIGIAISNDSEALEHLLENYTVLSDNFARAIRYAALENNTKIMEDLLGYLGKMNLTELGKAILCQTFWEAVLNDKQNLVTIFSKSFFVKFINDSEQSNLKQFAEVRYKEAYSIVLEIVINMIRC